MSKGKLLSKLNFFKKKKRVSRETLRSNSTMEPRSNTMESIPELVRGNTLPVISRNSSGANLYSNKRKNISSSSVEDTDKKKKQPYLGPDQASSSDCPIPTPAPSATTSSVCHNISAETNKKEKNRSSSPVSMCCDNNESEAVASSSGSNDQKDKKMKEVEIEDKKSIDNSQKVNISENSNEIITPSTSTPNINNKNKNLDTPPHTPTIFVTSKSTISSIDADDSNGNGNDANRDADTNTNEVKNHVDEFDLYVEDIFNKLALDTNLTTEADTEASPNRFNRAATEHYNPAEHLTTESLTPIHSSLNLTAIPNQSYQPVPSTLSTVQTNDITPTTETNNNVAVNTLNNNTKKEAYNNETDTLKKNNDNKKEKIIEEDSSSRGKENKTNDNKAKNNDIEKYLEKETTHTVAESMDILNNTIEMLKCGICLDILLDPKIVEPCGHSFCNHCLRLLQTRVCPLCRTRIHAYHTSILLNELSELVAKFTLNAEQMEERKQCLKEMEEKDKHLNDECMRLMELMELAHQPENQNNYSVQFNELVELNETDDDI